MEAQELQRRPSTICSPGQIRKSDSQGKAKREFRSVFTEQYLETGRVEINALLKIKKHIMGKVGIKVEWCGKNYAACPENEDIACVVTHKTLEGLQMDMDEALRQHIAWMVEDGDALPVEFTGEIELEYHLTTRAQLHYSETFITRKALAEITGINLQQLSHYANGWRNPRPDMQKRISEGIRSISCKLAVIS